MGDLILLMRNDITFGNRFGCNANNVTKGNTHSGTEIMLRKVTYAILEFHLLRKVTGGRYRYDI